mgnify:CR=1 FL=1
MLQIWYWNCDIDGNTVTEHSYIRGRPDQVQDEFKLTQGMRLSFKSYFHIQIDETIPNYSLQLYFDIMLFVLITMLLRNYH